MIVICSDYIVCCICLFLVFVLLGISNLLRFSQNTYIHVSYYIVQNTNSFKEIMVMFQVIFFFYISVCESKENEVYYKCQLEACYTTCQHLKTPPPCPSIAAGCFQPACICKGGFLRNAEGKCVPEDQCRKYLN